MCKLARPAGWGFEYSSGHTFIGSHTNSQGKQSTGSQKNTIDQNCVLSIMYLNHLCCCRCVIKCHAANMYWWIFKKIFFCMSVKETAMQNIWQHYFLVQPGVLSEMEEPVAYIWPLVVRIATQLQKWWIPFGTYSILLTFLEVSFFLPKITYKEWVSTYRPIV